MEGRMRKYGHTSPERSRARTEPPPKQHHHHHHHHQQQPPQPQPQQRQQQQQWRRVPVVYYLCRNRHLEHPHFIEVPTSSPEGLYLRDVINRLNVLRGKAMAAMYSWSCKRGYKNGFVWHDLSEDDLILPANGNEYVLKGSELLDSSPSDRSHHAAGRTRSQASRRPKQETPSPSSSRSQDASPSSPGVIVSEVKAPPPSLSQPPPSPARPLLPAPAPEDELSPQNISPESKPSPPFGGGGGGSFPSPADYWIHKASRANDASTQTEEAEGASRRVRPSRGGRTREVSTEGGSVELELEDHRRQNNQTPPRSKGSSEISRDEIFPPPASSPSSGGKTETLESLIRAEARKMNNFRILEEEELLASTSPKLRATSVLMQLITCGSLSVKGHHSFGFIPTYKPKFSHGNFPSPIYSSSMVLGELDCPSKNSGMMGLRMEEKQCYSGNLVEIKKHKEGGGELVPSLQRSSSNRSERSCKSPDPTGDSDRVADFTRSKCLPRTAKTTSGKQSMREMARSPLSDGPRNSSAGLHCHQCASLDSSKESSQGITDASSVKGSSMRLEPFQNDKERVIKIEESLLRGLGL